jgi:hypothetical protein
MPNSGTPRKMIIAGVTYDVAADSNFTFNRSEFEKEGVATSGKTMIKMTRRVPTIESVTLITTLEEVEALKNVADSIADTTISVEFADGSVYKTTGQINFENYETEEGKSTFTIIPAKTKEAWTPFLP